MRHNYFNLNQIKSNPDGQPTVNRQSRLMSYRGNLKNLAMIFAVLVMSMANIGMAWGATTAPTGGPHTPGTTSTVTANGRNYEVFFSNNASTSSLLVGSNTSATTQATSTSGWCNIGSSCGNNNNKISTAFTLEEFVSNVKTSNNKAIRVQSTASSERNIVMVISGYDSIAVFGKSNDISVYAEIWNGSSYGADSALTLVGSKSQSSHYKRRFALDKTKQYRLTLAYGTSGSTNKDLVAFSLCCPASSCAATANAGADKSTTVGVGVAMAATAASSGYTGAWSIKAGSPSTATSQLGTTSSNTMTFTPNTYGTYTLVWTVTDNEDGSCSATDEATVTVPAPTHSITYTNLKGADNSANPTTYTEGVGVASFANLRHVVGYDFTGWSPSSISSSATTDQTIDAQWTARAAAAGTGTLTYALAFETSTITTSSITRNNGALYDATDVSIAHTSFNDGAAKNGCSGKLTTTSAKDASNYVELTFKIADGYTFTPTEVQVRGNAVSTAKTMEVELKDNAATPNTKSVSGSLAEGSTSGGSTVTLDFDASGTVTLEGTVTLKIFVYGATNHWRLGTSIIVNGTVASAAPSCTAPTDLAISGEYVHFPGETLTLTVSGDNIAQDATYTWKKGDQVIAGQTTATLTINSCEITDAGNYTCTVSNGNGCEATANYTVKMYSLRGLTDNNWTTDFVFTKVNATTATYSMELAGNSSYYFKVYDGSAYYGNTGGNPTMTSDNCTNWTMQENMGNNVTLQTTAAGTYTFTLDYTNASNPTISVTYPAKRIVYLNPGVWYTGENQEKFVVHAWYSSTVQDILMTKIDDCADRNIYQAEIDANHEQVIFIRVNPAGLNLSNPWSNEWNRTKDLTLISENQFTINNWGGTGEWNDGTEKSSGAWENFTPNYTVTFDANNHGTAPDAQCVAKNGRATTPAAPTATGYTFGGWYKEAGCINAYDFNTEVTSNITLYAKWTAETYNIKYFEAIGDDATGQDLRELTIGGAIATYTIEDAITLPELPAKDGYTATGWYTKWCVFPDDGGNGNGWEGCTPIMIQPVGYYGHTNFIVKYTPNTYTITWNANGGNALTGTYTSGNVNYGAAITKPADPTRTGYTFAGWHNGTSIVTPAATMPANDVTYTAQWTCTTPTISTQPINATYTQNTAAAALSVTATANDGTLSYQWQSSTDNSNFTNISGATGNEYTPRTTEVGTTYYRCVVTNTTGSCIVTSASATITVTAASVEPDPEPEAVPQVGTFTGAGTSGTVNLYWTMPTKPVTTTVDIASATLSAAEGQSTGATSTITKENTNEIKVEYSTTEGWQATGVKIPLATPKTNVESITFEYKSDPSQSVDLIPFLYDGTRWVESNFTKLTPTEWTSHTSVITQEAWNNSNIYSKDKTIQSVNFYANPATAEEGTFYIRNVVLNQGTQVAASGLIIVRKEGSNPTSPTDTDGTIVYNGNGIAATCTDNGLENGTTYHYAAYAHDGQGNYSEPLYWQYTYREGLNTYAPDDTDFPNPERGFYEQVQWNANKGYDAVIGDSYFDDARAASRSLILRIYYMDSEALRTNQQLLPAFIEMFNEDMAKFRNNGMKCILRFAYDEDSSNGDYQDASPATWATHLAQLTEHLQANADVIYVVQAGFLGVWGEWYYSDQGIGTGISKEIKNNLIDQLLAAVPANRCVQLRTPLFKKEYLGSTDALTPATAYQNTAKARLGHHNDAFLNGAANQGTYENRATDMEYIAQECLYVPIGGETNLEESQVDDLYEAYCKGTVAEAEMAQLHYSYLNYSYSTVVTNRWKAEGSYARMSKYMGYRFELASASLPNKATAGTQMNVQLNIKNVGYAPLYNERHAYIVFKNNTNTYSIQLSSDPRTWAPNSAVTPINENIALPADMVAGTYDMYLHLPDASANIANNPKYAVRFANQGIWESETGYNKLNKQVVVTATDLATYTITYDLNGGTGTLPTQAATTAGGTFTLASSNNINKSGYTFAGWSDGTDTYAAGAIYTMPANNVTFTAQWTANEYSITYKESEGGTVISELSPTAYTYGTGVATLPTPTKAGYTFDGWYLDYCVTDEGKGMTDECKRTSIATTDFGNVTLLAKWTEDVQDPEPGTETCITFGDKKEVSESTATTELEKFTIETKAVNNNATKFGENDDYIIITAKQGYIQKISMDGAQNGIKVTSSTNNTTYSNEQSLLFSSGSELQITTQNVTSIKIMRYGGNVEFSEICITTSSSTDPEPTTYNVTTTLTNVTANSEFPATITADGSIERTITASDGYTLPSAITVTGANYTWDSSTGVLSITDATDNVTITIVGVVAATYALNYECNGAESGCPSNVAATTNLPNPLPSAPTKDGYTFGGWYTDEDLTVDAEAGAALTGNTTLYAKWTVNSSSECITIAYFETTAHNNSSSKPDNAGKYIYGYTNSAKTEAYAYTITSSTGDNKGQGTGESDYLRMNYGTTVTIYADNTTTSGTPASFENVTGVSVDFKMKNSSYYTLFDIYVGDTKIADDVSLLGDAQTAFTTFAYEGLAQLSGTVRIVNKGSSSSNYHFYVDNIKICTAALPSCTTPELSNLENKKVCPGEDVSWTAIVNNTASLQDGEMITYQWNKKGNSTVLSSDVTLTLNDVTEATGGTYVVTATVSADGKASATATKEVTLTVTPATATPTITANANTIYTGNSVTLTASCASSGVGYQWYTCTDAEGTNAQAIGGETNATYTFTAGEAGTYYYKVIVTGDGTHSCGTAEKVYTLVVSASNSGETTCGEIKGQFTSGAYTFDTGFIIYGINSGGNLDAGASSSSGNSRCGGSGSYFGKQRFVVTFPVDVLSFSFIGYQSNLRTVEAVKTTTELKTTNTEYTNITHTAEASQEGDCQTHVITPETAIPANTFIRVELSNGLNISEICYVPTSNVSCTDPQVIATVDNATVCEDTENVTFTATNYADGATLQWQKKNGNAWENIGATSATYTISPVTTEHAGQYRVIATKEECSRTSEELTLTVLTAPEFNAFANTASVMKGNALTINDVEATNATDYTWYKSADNSFDVAADTKVGTTKELLLAASSITEEADQAFYLFCVASNSCGSVTSNAITVTVTPFVEEECATAGNESNDHEFSFENTKCSEATLDAKKVWSTNSRNKYLTYTAPEGKYFATAKVTVAHTGGTKCGYAYSTNRGATWEVTELEGLSTTLTAITIELPANVNAFRISRNLTAQDGEKGSDSGDFYLAEACFTYENACTPTSVTPTTTSREYNISENADFEEPTFTVKHGEDIVNDAVLTYTSSNPAIATVDEEGSVTFEGMTGTVTITAAYAGTTIDEIEYCASEGSYTITVSCEDEEPKIIAAAGTNLDGCNNSITLEAKMQDGNSFTGGTFQWYRDGEAIDGATSASYEVVRAGTYTVSRTYTCTTMSSNPAVVTNENPEPKVERLTPFQYYHVDKDYSDQMKDRHLFAVTSYGTSDGKRYHLTATRNGEALELSSSTAFSTIPSSDNAVDTVMIDLNKLATKYDEGDEIVITCAPIDNCNQVSTITSSITIHVIGEKPTLALICSGANGDGTRDTEKLVVGGDFLTGYNKADLCQQTGNKTFDPNTEWGFYEALQDSFIVTPVNGYAQFNKLNYEPFDILLLTDYPKSSKSEAAQKIIDDMAELCDYRPLLSFKTHFQSDKWKDKTTGEYKYTKWVKKGFTTAPVVPKQSATYVNIVCYAHPMFKDIDNTDDEYTFHDDDDPNQLVYQVLTGPGYEGNKGIQGFELADADNFVTIGLVHYNAQANKVTHDDHTHISWNAEANDRLLVAMAERQTNIEARMMLFSLNCGAQSLQTEGGRRVILQCLKYLLETDPLEVADCRMTFDNGAGNDDFDPDNYEGTGTRGDSLWSTAANWGPDYLVVPGRNNDVRIAAPCIVDGVKTKVSVGNEVQETIQYYPEVLSIHITEDGSLTIPANSSLTARSTILRADENGNVYPTNVADISLGSNVGGNASLILNNERGDTKAGVAMYSTAKADTDTYSAAASTWQYIGTPHSDVANAIYNYYDSWLYQYDTGTEGWVVIPNGGPLVPFRGYCVTHPERPHTYWMEGTLVSTTNQDISIPAERFVVVANSWTAPIQINELTDDDMEGLTDKSIYFFNTGSDPNQEGELNQENGRYAAGTYVSVPIRSAPYTGDSVIPSMQGFYVVGGDADGTLHLDYERHVRAKRENVPSGPMHAPARIADTDNEPQVAKFLFRGTRYDDRLIILERPDFTRGYDSGWDGEQWGGNAAAPMSYVVTETRWDAVSAIPEYEGTVIAFRAGEDSEYTIHFDYDGMEEALYLLDTDTQIYTRVLKGNSYTFTCTDKAEHNRFILTRKAPQIATGTENIATGENAKAVKLIKDDKIFIFVNGMLYDATGKVVK